jgi:hypothetical protein
VKLFKRMYGHKTGRTSLLGECTARTVTVNTTLTNHSIAFVFMFLACFSWI